MNRFWDISQTGRALGCEPCTCCWPKSCPMAERVVDGTLMDTPLDRRASSAVPGLQLHHVARFCSNELAGFASAATEVLSLTWIWNFQSRVPAPQSEPRTPVSHRTFNNWELSLSIQMIHRGSKWLDTFLHGTEYLLPSRC